MKKVVWLASWYPNDADPFTGDFIARHARAVSAFQPIDLFFIGRNAGRPGKIPAPSPPNPGLTETLRYYNADAQPRSSTNWRTGLSYWKVFRRWFREYRAKKGLPDIVHVHVAWRAGLPALYLKKRYGIPYVLTEHWSAYYDNSATPLKRQHPLVQYLVKKILRNASLVMPVSTDLGRQMEAYAGVLPKQVVSNVVDTKLFYPGLAGEKPGRFRFVHVSAMNAGKNPAGILRAFQLLLDGGANAELLMIGPSTPPAWEGLFDPARVRFTGEITHEEVAAEMKRANAFVLFSPRENQPCVILEALCSGLPVIAGTTGGIPEIVNASNGLTVEPGNEKELTEAMAKMIAGYGTYNLPQIAKDAASQFANEIIGEAYASIYRRF